MKATQRPAPPRPPADASIWVMAGQSNMQGCGAFRDASKPDRRVWCFTQGHRWEIAKEPLHNLIESAAPIDRKLRMEATPPEIAAKDFQEVRRYWRKRSAGSGAGLGIAFGSAYAKATGHPVGLIAAAHGGTTLEQWSPSRRGEGLDSLYGAMLERVRLAGGNLRGILWYQGESDTLPRESETYAERFTEWVAAVRRDTGRPRLPIVTVQLGCVADVNRDAASWERVRQAQLELPRRIPRLAVVSSIDLGLKDSIHLDAPDLQRLGRRMARVALGLAGEGKPQGDGPRLSRFAVGANKGGLGETTLFFSGVVGGWRPERQITGFSVLDETGRPHPANAVTAAFRHRRWPRAIVVRTLAPLQAGEWIAYGAGLFPICNAVDEADMSPLAFRTQIEAGLPGSVQL